MHNHHIHGCEHSNVRYCKTCDIPYCADCGKEWSFKWYNTYTIQTTPYWKYNGTAAGNTLTVEPTTTTCKHS